MGPIEKSTKSVKFQVSLCLESGVVATPTPAPPLGERVFSIARPGSAITTSALANFDVSTDPWSPSELRLLAGAPDVDGVAPLELVDDVIIGAKIVDGSTFCIKIFAAGSHGTIDCDGGSAYDITDIYDSNGAGPSGAYLTQSGLGSDAGPGAATLFAGWNAFLLSSSTTIADCQNVSYFNGSPYAFTTATATGTFVNPVQGGTISQSATGQSFDCATWTQEDGPGKLLRPMLLTDSFVGDVANILALADISSIEPPPAPTISPTPSRTGTFTTPPTHTPTPTVPFGINTSTATPAGPFTFQSCPFGGTQSDVLILNIAGAAFPPLQIQGEVSVGCADGNASSRPCTCAFGHVDPVVFIGIGIICVDGDDAQGNPVQCPIGRQVCGASAESVKVDLFADSSIGACSNNADCQAQCDTYCAALQPPHRRFSSGCESHCQGGDRADQTCECDVLGSATCEPDSTLDCPLGSCEGKDNEVDVDCHCQCIDEEAPGASPGGALNCQLPTSIRIEANAPCDGSDVLVRLPPLCAPFTSDQSLGTVINANEDPASQIAVDPLQGASITCSAFDTSPAGMQLVTNLPFFDSTVGDLMAQLSLTCQP